MFWLAIVAAIRKKQQEEQARAQAMRQNAEAGNTGFTAFNGKNQVTPVNNTSSSGVDTALSIVNSASSSSDDGSAGSSEE